MPAARASIRPAVGIPTTYRELLRDVRAELFSGRVKIEHAWLLMFHNIGRLVHEHVLLHRDRADYAAQTFSRLADDTGVSRRVLYEWVQLYRCFPIVRQSAQLTRTHYRLLCQIGDENERKALTAQAIKNKWTSPELGNRVRALNAAIEIASDANGGNETDTPKAAVHLLVPKRGTPGLYRIVTRDDGLAVDVGFKLYLPLAAAESRGLKSGNIVRFENDGGVAVDEARSSDLFTYRATLRRMVDGDTLVVALFLPHYVMDEKLRLRGIDCPEMDTPEGRAAKRFVDDLLKPGDEVVLCTTKPDRYDRYLADVFLRQSVGEEIFLNNALLENSHATRMGVSETEEWTP